MDKEQQAGKPVDASKDTNSSAELARELIEMPEWPEPDQATDKYTGPTFVEGPPTPEHKARIERELAATFTNGIRVAVPRNPNDNHPTIWLDNTGWEVVHASDGDVIVGKIDKNGDILKKPVRASKLADAQPHYNEGTNVTLEGKQWVIRSREDNGMVTLASVGNLEAADLEIASIDLQLAQYPSLWNEQQ